MQETNPFNLKYFCVFLTHLIRFQNAFLVNYKKIINSYCYFIFKQLSSINFEKRSQEVTTNNKLEKFCT